jgi:glycosyltransferase involved in cell wall biosynthesis
MKISVVIPCYNYGRYLAGAIESVLSQTVKADEVVVVDDGSTDETSAEVKRYMSQVRYVYQENGGVSRARNRGARETGNDWVAFLDADDRWAPEKLDVQTKILASHPEIDVLVCDFWHVTEAGERIDRGLDRHWQGVSAILWQKYENPEVWVVQDRLPEALIQDYMMGVQMLVMKRSVFEKVGGLAEAYSTAEDLDFFLRLSKEGFQIALAPQPLGWLIQHPKSLSRNNSKTTPNLLKVLDEFENRYSLTPSERAVVRRQKGICELGMAWQAVERKEFSRSRYHAVRAFWLGRYRQGGKAWLRTFPILRGL